MPSLLARSVTGGIGVLEGWIPTIQAFIERNLYTVGGIAIAIALSQVSFREDWSTRGLYPHHSGLHREEPLHYTVGGIAIAIALSQISYRGGLEY